MCLQPCQVFFFILILPILLNAWGPAGLAQNPGPCCGIMLLAYVVEALARRSCSGMGPTLPYFCSRIELKFRSSF
jgi:hypothetical protein